MQNFVKIVGSFLLVCVLFSGCASCVAVGKYNNLVALDQKVQAKGAQVQNVYQRRSDLIPNVVESVKGYAQHESKTFTEIADARSRLGGQVNVNPAQMNSEQLKNFEQAQGQLGNVLGRLLVLKEAYPELKANTLFLDLTTELEGTENRIAVERREYNLAAQGFNTTRNQFPTVLFASMFGFEPKPYFSAEEGAKTAPRVKF